jgi:hypothetical protein
MTALKPRSRILYWSAIAGIGLGGFAAAQEAPPASTPSKSTAQIDAGEPRADTSSPAPGGASSPSNATPAPAASSAGKPAGKPGTAPQPAAQPKAAGQKAPGGVDRLQLNTATVTGDREQPKVMYIVPWKSSDIGDLSGKPMNSLLDEALAPVDRDEFKREVVYFNAVKADGSQNGTSGGTAKQGEK